MSSTQTSFAKLTPKGVNGANLLMVKAVCPGVLDSGGVITIKPDDAMDITAIPMSIMVWRPGTPDTLLYPIGASAASQFASATFDPTTGYLAITNGTTAWAAGDVVYILYFENP